MERVVGTDRLLELVPSWRTQEGATLLSTRIFTVRERDCRSPTSPGKAGTFVFLDSPDWVNVIALTKDREVVAIEQFRHGTREVTLEIPGGMVDSGEDARTAGLRELREETGYTGDDAEVIGAVTPNPAFLTNRCHTVLVRDVEARAEQDLDTNEEIGVRLLPLSTVWRLSRDGTIHHALVLAAFHHLVLRHPELLTAG